MSEYPQKVEDRIPESWGKNVGVPKTWYPYIADLDIKLSALAPEYVVHQVKTKFGSLRFYIDETSFPKESLEEALRLIEDTIETVSKVGY